MQFLDEAHADYERFWPAFLVVGTEWDPQLGPRGHRDRIQRYRRNEKIYRGDHAELMQPAWDRLLRSRGFTFDEIKELQVTVPLCTQVSDFPADMLFSERPLLQASDLEGEQAVAAKKWLSELERVNHLQRVFYQGATSQSYRGDSLLKVRHQGTGGHSIIEAQCPDYWFPYTNPDNVKEIWAHVLAWKRELTVTAEQMGAPWWQRLLAVLGLAPNTRTVTVLRAEVHFKGLVVNRMYLLEDSKLKRELPLDLLPEYSLETHPEYDETGVDDFLILHVPNFELDNQLEGVDDYTKLRDLQREINIRVTQTGRVLDKNQAPVMYGPKLVEQFDPDAGRWVMPKGFEGGYIGIEDDAQVTPGAVTWDGHEEQAQNQVEQLVDYFFMAAGLSRAPWGDKKAGGDEAAAAIQRKMLRALATVARKRIPWDDVIPEAIYLAMQLDKAANPAAVSWEPFRPGIHWQDGLPVDEDMLVERLVKAVDGRVMSQETAIRIMHPSWDDETIQDEIAKIEAGQQSLRDVLAPGTDDDLNGPDGQELLQAARKLMTENPDLTEEQALEQVRKNAGRRQQGAA